MKLEYGKRYVMRNGEVTGKLRPCSLNRPFSDGYRSWPEGGVYYAGLFPQYDIVAEFNEDG